MQLVLLDVFIQLGLHMVDTVPEGIRVNQGGHNIQYTRSPSSLSTGTLSSSNSSMNSTMVWIWGVEVLARFRWCRGSCQVLGGIGALARFSVAVEFLLGYGGVGALARFLVG